MVPCFDSLSLCYATCRVDLRFFNYLIFISFSYGKIQLFENNDYVEWSDTVMFKFFVQNVHISQWNISFYYRIKFSTFYMTTNILHSYYFICLSLMLVCRHNGFRTITFSSFKFLTFKKKCNHCCLSVVDIMVSMQ